MASTINDDPQSQELDNDNCVVCFKTSLIYSIGSCNHAVCFECSSRMRCVCLQNECPICRADLPKVIFTKTVAPFATLDRELRSGLYEKKFRIAFADLEIQNAFYRLLENRCPMCDHTPFVEFPKLKEHVRKVHERFYCEICTDNLKIFSSERRCYTRERLATHRRLGDADDKSHKGHPRCEYCELRFLDKDELFRHLRREHYFCHLCDADGINLFYGAINEMRDHFKSEHYLCEEEQCEHGAAEQFTAVFRSEIDLRAHVAVAHCHGMSKSAVKQARTIDLEFSYGPRGRGGGQENSRGGRVRTNDTQREFDRRHSPEPVVVQQSPIRIDSKNEDQFPSLAGPSAAGSSVQLANTVRHINYGTSGLARTKENFPALGGAPVSERAPSAVGGKQSRMPTASSMLRSTATSSKPKTFNGRSSASSSAGLTTTSDFPALSQPTSKKNRNKADLLEDMILPAANAHMSLVSSKHRGLVEDNYVSMASKVSKVQTVQRKEMNAAPDEQVKKNVPKLNSADNFPTLGAGSSAATSAPQWLTVKSNAKPQPKQATKDFPMHSRKVHEMPSKDEAKPQNGMKKSENVKVAEKEKPKASNSNKENKNKNLPAAKDFPALSADPTPPPGFTTKAKKPPPGFTNISSPSSDANGFPTDYEFSHPPNASKRNQALVSEFQKALKTPESMQEFRQISQMFRDGDYLAKAYYDTCKVVLASGFDSIFPELLVLLPDIDKQQSLYSIHKEATRQGEATSKKKNKAKEFEVCATCDQVLLPVDLSTHLQSHTLENNFPALSRQVKQGKK